MSTGPTVSIQEAGLGHRPLLAPPPLPRLGAANCLERVSHLTDRDPNHGLAPGRRLLPHQLFIRAGETFTGEFAKEGV